MHKKCNKLPTKMQRWKTKCMYLCFLPTPYKIAPIVYTMPPISKSKNPANPSNCGKILILKIMHHPITK